MDSDHDRTPLRTPALRVAAVAVAVAALILVSLAVVCVSPAQATASRWNVEVVQTSANLSERMRHLHDLKFTAANTSSPSCEVSQLRLTTGIAHSAADRYSQAIVFTNISGKACTMRGYPHIQLAAGDGRILHVAIRRGGGYGFVDHGSTLVTLVRGATASFAFGGLAVDLRRHRRCALATAVWVTPPSDRERLRLKAIEAVCPEGVRTSALGAGRDSASLGSARPVIHINARTRYQRVAGFGAAMTDSSAWLIQGALPPAPRAELMNDLFGRDGIHLNNTLVPMGASDFTRAGTPYTYDDIPPGQSDPDLSHFSIAHDELYIIPAIRRMLAVNPRTKIFAVPWSPPAWMKSNAALDNLGRLGGLLPSAYEPFANYFIKFIEAYSRYGIPIAALAPENEPLAAPSFPAMAFPEPDEADWIVQDLQPPLQAANLHPRIYGYDSGWESTSYARALLADKARSALKGIAWHCYSGTPSVMSTVHAVAPALDGVVAECSPGITSSPVPEEIIGSLRNWASTVLLWNLALDPAGGPVQPPNPGCHGCTGLVTIDVTTNKLTFNPAYYQLGQFGKFILPGARRIGAEHFVSQLPPASGPRRKTEGLDDVAVLNPDGSKVLVAYNNSPTSIRFAVDWRGRSFTYALWPKATVTFVWDRPASREPDSGPRRSRWREGVLSPRADQWLGLSSRAQAVAPTCVAPTVRRRNRSTTRPTDSASSAKGQWPLSSRIAISACGKASR